MHYFSQIFRRIGITILLFSLKPVAIAQTYKFDDILYGVAYYHEYLPTERLDEDVRLMKAAGINFVRLGESTWQLWEPQEGVFKFDWMDRVVDRMHKAGIKVIMGTPTYSIPAWLYKKHPEITVINENGEQQKYGMRQNVDLSNPVFNVYCEKIIKQIVDHYKDNPAVIGYQLDNETHAKGASGPAVFSRFLAYLKKKFVIPDSLNKAWGLNYWGQAITKWDELQPVDGFMHPNYRLEWSRFQENMTTGFLERQADLVKKYKGGHQFIMHDHPGAFRNDIDERAIAQFIDYPGMNIYHYDQDKSDGLRISLFGSFARSLKPGNYLVPETNAASIGWNSADQFPPYDGQLRLNFYSHIGSGANLISYWHWHSLHTGIEQYWRGILPHDLKPGRIYNEVSRIGNERARVGKELVNLTKRNKIAILYSIDSQNGLIQQRFDNNMDGFVNGPYESGNDAYLKIINRFYKALYDLNVEADFVFPDGKNFERYDMIIVPPLYIASDKLLEQLNQYVLNGGHLMLNFKSGFADENSKIRHQVMPGALSEICGFTYNEFSSLRDRIPLKSDPFQVGDKNFAEQWAEFIVPTTAKTLASYDHPFFGKYAAITRNEAGKGVVTYFGTVGSLEVLKKVLRNSLEELKLIGADQDLPEKLKVKHAFNASGKAVHFYYNFSDKSMEFKYPYKTGKSILANTRVEKNGLIQFAPWDVVIVKEE